MYVYIYLWIVELYENISHNRNGKKGNQKDNFSMSLAVITIITGMCVQTLCLNIDKRALPVYSYLWNLGLLNTNITILYEVAFRCLLHASHCRVFHAMLHVPFQKRGLI